MTLIVGGLSGPKRRAATATAETAAPILTHNVFLLTVLMTGIVAENNVAKLIIGLNFQLLHLNDSPLWSWRRKVRKIRVRACAGCENETAASATAYG